LAEIALRANGPTGEEIGPVAFAPGVTIVRNVVRATLTPCCDSSHGPTAVIVAPGGAYRFLAIEHEGTAVAAWLCTRGTAAYVLKYRTVPTPADEAGFREELGAMFTRPGGWAGAVTDDLLSDGAVAVRLVRERHAHVVMVGFSAGAKLTIETLWSDAPPDAAALIYPPPVEDHDAAPSDAPPLFALMANDDPLSTRGVSTLQELWREAKRPMDVHLFARGGHGFGTNPQGLPIDRWLDLLGEWLESLDLE
jgi:dienelactone hydrolase